MRRPSSQYDHPVRPCCPRLVALAMIGGSLGPRSLTPAEPGSSMSNRLARSQILACAVLVVYPILLAAATEPPLEKPADPQAITFFEQKIRPVLSEHCLPCHSTKAKQAKKLKAGLYLDTRDGVRKGS